MNLHPVSLDIHGEALTERERVLLRMRQDHTYRHVARHGAPSGVRRHRELEEPLCPACSRRVK